MDEEAGRPRLDDSLVDLIVKLSVGDPGAVLVLETAAAIDHDPYGLLLQLDEMNVTGARIWEVYKDVCGKDIGDFIRRVRERTLYN